MCCQKLLQVVIIVVVSVCCGGGREREGGREGEREGERDSQRDRERSGGEERGRERCSFGGLDMCSAAIVLHLHAGGRDGMLRISWGFAGLRTCALLTTDAAATAAGACLPAPLPPPHTQGPVRGLSVHPTGRLAVSVGHDRLLKLWHLGKGRCSYTARLEVEADDVAFSADGQVGGGVLTQ